ncbi:sensor histidine kinase [Nocardiopsis sp. FIRDI 009]|uniref:sensor histidine kinase n=1 Tax=Nocardiopsis sp. FIRDI 009 TaxID=714197 RepID=UPI000E2436E0|nr:sensor histidine kinase [Nocardiopsis sp. FIRDI 009]
MKDLWERAWRSDAYLLVALVSAMATLVLLPLTLAVAVTVAAGGIGLLLLPRWFRVLGAWARAHLAHAASYLGVAVPEAALAPVDDVRSLPRSRTTRRLLTWMPLFTLSGLGTGLVAVVATASPLAAARSLLWWLFPEGWEATLYGLPVDGWGTALAGVVIHLGVAYVLARWALPPLARLHARLSVRLLTPSEAEVLAARVDELSRTRAGVVDAHGAELRRIERDLHDGTQARLVAIAMQLGVAREAVEAAEADPAVATLLRDAHRGTEEAMAELREVIRGIYPPILADRGLAGALAALVARTTVPTRLDADDLGRLPVAVETAAYYVVTEAVANAARHSGAESITVRLTRDGHTLRVTVRDDGSGGVDETRGSGVSGIRHRVAALDGRVRVDSPAGGPTEVGVELPCAS